MHGEFNHTPKLVQENLDMVPNVTNAQKAHLKKCVSDEREIVRKAEAKLLQKIFASTLRNTALPDLSNQAKSNPFINLRKFMNAGMEEVGELPIPEKNGFPAGYTYFGQLLAHDITSHRFTGTVPSLRLASLYGMGPEMAAHLYQYEADPLNGTKYRLLKFQLQQYVTADGQRVFDPQRLFTSPMPDELGRQRGLAIIADARNDQNFLLSQMCVEMMRLHNFIVEYKYDPQKSNKEIFEAARDTLVLLYQAVILYDYLPRLVGKDLVQHLRDPDNFVFFKPNANTAGLSQIFSMAAFRFGHSQVRQIYDLGLQRQRVHLFGQGTEMDLKGIVRDTRRAVDWRLFLDTEDKTGIKPQRAKEIDHKVAIQLNNVFFSRPQEKNLIERNLNLSATYFPAGIHFFRALCQEAKANRLHDTEKEVLLNAKGKGIELEDKINKALAGYSLTVEQAPLWLFLLLEAELLGEKGCLGPLGSRIIAEQIMSVLQADNKSLLNEPEKFDRNFFFGKRADEGFSLPDLLSWVLPSLKSESIKATAAAATTKLSLAPVMFSTADNALTYLGIENDNITQQNDYTGYKEDFANELFKTSVLNNGFYDLSVRTPELIDDCRNGILLEPGPAVCRIRVYVSLKNIARVLGKDIANEAINDKDIKGLFFNFGIRQGNSNTDEFVLIARRTGIDGKLPESASDRLLVGGTASAVQTNFTATNVADLNDWTANFLADNFQLLKNRVSVIVPFSGNALWEMLNLKDSHGPLIPDIPGAPNDIIVEFHVVVALGSQANTEDNNLDTKDKSFFTLLMSRENGNSPFSLLDSRPWPPNCYGRSPQS